MKNNLSIYLNSFFNQYLPLQKNVSANTIKSYKSTFELFFNYCKDKGVNIFKIDINIFTEKIILEFLSYLENERNNSITTRNQRLAAICSFIKHIYTKENTHILEFQKILNIPYKKSEQKMIEYLSIEALEIFLAQPNLKSKQGRRDLAILVTLYDTGARVSELINLKVKDINFENGNNATVQLLGKGNKRRIVPIISNTVNILQNYISENNLTDKFENYLFTNNSNTKLTDSGITYIIEKYKDLALTVSNTIPKHITPHTFRHTKAIHLLEAGVPMVHIKDILGHSDLRTTEIYAKVSVEEKRKALNNVFDKDNDLTNIECSWNKDDKLLDFLMTL